METRTIGNWKVMRSKGNVAVSDTYSLFYREIGGMHKARLLDRKTGKRVRGCASMDDKAVESFLRQCFLL